MIPHSDLKPLYETFSYTRLETVLYAYLPSKLEHHFQKTGIYAVDTFVISAIATLLIVAIKLLIQQVQGLALRDKQPKNEKGKITVLIEPTTQDDYRTSKSWISTNDQQPQLLGMIQAHMADGIFTLAPNVFHEALSSLVSQNSQSKSAGNYILRPNLQIDHGALEPPAFNIVPQSNQVHDGHSFQITFENNDRESVSSKENSGKFGDVPTKVEPSIRLSVLSREEAVTVATLTSFLNEVARQHLHQQESLHKQIRSRYDYSVSGKWVRICSLYEVQGLQSVALCPENEKRIKADLASFLDNKAFYRRVGFPYRRGYFLHGSPGTGKTSLVFAIASELKRHLYFINLSYIDSDAELFQAFASVPAHSILVFEDVDTMTTSNDKEGVEERRFNLGTFLSILDGHTLEEGIVFIMTTNHKELLDPAVIRPGRMDVHLELTFATHYQMRRIYRMVVDEDNQSTLDDVYPGFSEYVPEFLIPPSEIMQAMVLCRDRLTAIPDQLDMLVKKYHA
ncbi:hypothetical protein DFQ28_003437 [Apophysomyces sp. BC1034]|nr:hypothetical protein DFQ28_003437 [Apophysomyces sp. BC1034]